MKHKVIIGLFLVTGAFTFATAALSFSEEASGDSIALSNAGTAIDASALSSQAKAALAATGATDEASRLMGVLGGRAFFRLEGDAGETCYASGTAAAPPSFGTIACPEGFPTERTPILDQSAFTYQTTGEVRLLSVEGFAADAVAYVGIIDTAGNVYKVKVRNNLYRFSSVPESTAKAIVAFDHSGVEVYSLDLTRS